MFAGVVLNPRARRNRRARRDRAERLSALLGEHGEVVETASVDELGEVLERLLPRSTHLVSDGGDGALNWMIHEVRRRRPDPDEWPAFVPTNGGTIDFVARKAGLKGRARAILKRLRDAAERGEPPPEVELDSLRVRGRRADGSDFDRLGFALAAGGIGNRFFDKYYEDPDPTPATIVRVIARTVGGYARSGTRSEGSYAAHLFEPTRARVVIDGEPLPSESHAGLHAGAFDVNLGGVLRVFPRARARGVLHFQAGSMSPAEIIARLPQLVAGGSLAGPELRDGPGEHMHVEAAGEEPLSPIIDGERFEGLVELDVTSGPIVRIARA